MKEGKMSLTGVRQRSRKRDVKKKYEPEVFAEEVIRLILEDEDDLEKAFANIQKGVNDSSSPIDFETYGETFWEIFVAGGVVAPGGEVSREEDMFNTSCVFEMPLERIPELNNLAKEVLQRHRFMRPILEDVLSKVCMFINKYDDEHQLKLGRFMAIFISELQAEASMVTKLQHEKSLVDSGEALRFCTTFFREFLSISSAEKLARALRAGKADRVLTLMPSTKRTPANLFKHFEEAGLPGYTRYLQSQTHDRRVEDMSDALEELLGDIVSNEETAEAIKLLAAQQALDDKDVVACIMGKLLEFSEFNGKNRAKEMMKYVVSYAELFTPFCKKRSAELVLMKTMLEFIQEDPDLEKAFMPTCQALYEHDANVLGEEAIIEWYDAAVKSGDEDNAPYIKHMAPFVEWLQEADEDDEEE